MLGSSEKCPPRREIRQNLNGHSRVRLLEWGTMSDEGKEFRTNVGRYSIVVKAVVFRGDEVLLMRRSDYIPSKAGEWDIPGGVLRKDEDPIEGLKRETQEEAGIRIEVGACFGCFWFGHVGQPSHLGLSFAARYIDGEVTASVEHTHVGWYSTDSLPDDVTDWVCGSVKEAIACKPA